MINEEKKARLTITLSKEVIAKLDEFCGKLNLPRSVFVELVLQSVLVDSVNDPIDVTLDFFSAINDYRKK